MYDLTENALLGALRDVAALIHADARVARVTIALTDADTVTVTLHFENGMVASYAIRVTVAPAHVDTARTLVFEDLAFAGASSPSATTLVFASAVPAHALGERAQQVHAANVARTTSGVQPR